MSNANLLVRTSTIYYPQTLRNAWPRPLADQWYEQYPELFDEKDLGLTQSEGHRNFHFVEWFTAVHLFQRDGASSLMEKYIFKSHERKVARCLEILTEDEWRFLNSLWYDDHVQPPDLLVIGKDNASFSFAEVKGPGDSISEAQEASHHRIANTLGKTIEVFEVRTFDVTTNDAT
jgi:hypothetical protein